MSRFDKFNTLSGENWVTGRYLLPVLKKIGQKETGDVLDLACGDSPFRCYFEGARTYCRVDWLAKEPEVITGDMLAIPIADQSVDTVLLFQAITDVPKPSEVLTEVARVLRPGGCLIVFESMAYPEHDTPHDYFRLMPEGLRVLATDAGFNVTRLTRLGGLFTRFATLWNTFIMGGLKTCALLRPIAVLGIIVGNMIFYGLDRLMPHSRLASDYLAVLTIVEPCVIKEANTQQEGERLS